MGQRDGDHYRLTAEEIEEGRALFAALSMALPGHRLLLIGTHRPGMPEEWVAVFGCGGVGLSAVMIARALGARVLAIDIDLKSDEAEVTDSDHIDYPASQGYRKILVNPVTINVETRIEGELWTLKVENDAAKFIFKPDRTDDPTTYTLIYQQDLHTGLLRLTLDSSWTTIKGLF